MVAGNSGLGHSVTVITRRLFSPLSLIMSAAAVRYVCSLLHSLHKYKYTYLVVASRRYDYNLRDESPLIINKELKDIQSNPIDVCLYSRLHSLTLNFMLAGYHS